MPRHGGKKHGSLKKAVNKDKHNKNLDPALQNFSCLDGIVVDFQKLFNYQPPLLPIYDVRLIDRFNPTVAKYEYVMIKIEEEFHSMDYSVTKFSRISKKLVKIFNQMKNVWEISPDFVQKQILKAYDQLPQITLESALSLNDPCMLDFMTLTIAMKYIIILRKYER
ncbi:unnamed protein product [Auanema sp. JU1783]|nr:unnamed protein product [Auanema sp. JU1783]